MKLAGGKSRCRSLPVPGRTGKSVLGATTLAANKVVKIGVGERSFSVGEEFVFYRHEKTFYHPPGILFRVEDTWTGDQIISATKRVRDESFTRVGTECPGLMGLPLTILPAPLKSMQTP